MPEDRAVSVEARARFLLHALHHLQELCGKEKDRRSGVPPQDAEALRPVRTVRGRVRPGQGSGHAEEVPWRSVINCTKPGGAPYPPPQELGQATPSPAHKAILCGCQLHGCPVPVAPGGSNPGSPLSRLPHRRSQCGHRCSCPRLSSGIQSPRPSHAPQRP